MDGGKEDYRSVGFGGELSLKLLVFRGSPLYFQFQIFLFFFFRANIINTLFTRKFEEIIISTPPKYH